MVKSHKYQILWDENALSDFIQVLNYLEERSEQAPKIVKSAVLDRLDQIRLSPLLFEADSLKRPSDNRFRAFVVFSYRVTYMVNKESMEIYVLRIRHTSREPMKY